MEDDLFSLRGWLGMGATAAHQPQLAVEEIDITPTRSRLPCAMDARRWRSHDLLAGGTLVQCRRFAALASRLRAVLRARVKFERPLDMILGQPVTMPRAGVIENDRVRLAGRRAQHPADHLAVEAKLLRGARENAAADLRHVPPLGEHHAVAHQLGLAGAKAREDGLAVEKRGATVEVLGARSEARRAGEG